MKPNWKGALVLAAIIILFLILVLKSEKANCEPLNVTWDNTYLNRWMYWGVAFSEEDVFQSTLTLNRGAFTAIIFTNHDFQLNNWNELDFIADYSRPITTSTRLNVGFLNYHYKIGDWVNTQEIYLQFSTAYFLNPAISYHTLFGDVDGNYLELAVLRNFPVYKDYVLSASGKLGYNNKAFREKSGLSHIQWNVSLPVGLPMKMTLISSAGYSWALSDDLESIFFGGVNLSRGF